MWGRAGDQGPQEYSDHPTRSSSVVIFKKLNGLQPPSALKLWISLIRIEL